MTDCQVSWTHFVQWDWVWISLYHKDVECGASTTALDVLVGQVGKCSLGRRDARLSVACSWYALLVPTIVSITLEFGFVAISHVIFGSF